MKDMMKQFKVKDPFFDRYIGLINEVVIPYQEKILHDEIEEVEKSQAIGNFELAAEMLNTGRCSAEFYGMVFQDSDVAKWLEASAYSLYTLPDKDLEGRCDQIIDLIGRAQWEDGYLNTYFTVKAPEKRWTNLEEAHELYCAGHMMEAAVAYFEVTGKHQLLDIMTRMADHIYDRFIVKKVKGYPGHPEVELALMRMYSTTGNEKCLTLAKHFVDVRGVDGEYYREEKRENNWSVWGNRTSEDLEYLQAHKPVREQEKAVGHSVRAVYLYTGMADLAIQMKDESLTSACKTLWNNMIDQRMYVTGAIGSAYEGEAFTKDYHLPNDTAYAETCAAIGLIFFARRMLELDPNGHYSDIMEKALYNGVLPGMQLDGKKFFYVNPLEVMPGISGQAATHKHARPQRPNWFACACCPPNVARLLPSIGKYAWGQKGDTVYSHLFIGGELELDDAIGGKIKVESGMPYEGKVIYRFEPKSESMKVTLGIRMPSWSEKTVITVNGSDIDYDEVKGYAYITREFIESDLVEVSFDMKVHKIYAHNKVSSNSQRMALQKGPLIYCVEGADNKGDVLSLAINKESGFREVWSDIFGQTINITAKGVRKESSDALYSYIQPKEEEEDIHFIPYYVWGNRGLNEMRVWVPYQ